MMEVGIVGCGKQAPKHISGLVAAGVQKITVCDIDAVRARDFAAENAKFGVHAADSLEDLLANPSISGVSICTPTPAHAPVIRSAIKAGKHFLCEKPLCETASEANELAALAAEAGVVGTVGYIYRYAPVFEKTKQIVGADAPLSGHSETLGKISNAFLRIGGRGSHMAWKHKKAAGGGAINEMLVHMLDLSYWFFGKAQSITLLDCDLKWPERVVDGERVIADAEDFVLARMRTESGVDVLLQADMITPAFTQYLEIQGSNGSVFGSIQPDFSSFLYCHEARGGYPKGKTTLAEPPRNLFDAQMGDFVHAMKTGSSTRCPVGESAFVMQMLESLRP